MDGAEIATDGAQAASIGLEAVEAPSFPRKNSIPGGQIAFTWMIVLLPDASRAVVGGVGGRGRARRQKQNGHNSNQECGAQENRRDVSHGNSSSSRGITRASWACVVCMS